MYLKSVSVSVKRNLSTAEARRFWKSAERDAARIQQWPASKRAGIDVSNVLEQPRSFPTRPSCVESRTRPARPRDR